VIAKNRITDGIFERIVGRTIQVANLKGKDYEI
jgi:hypothetical protein